MRTGGLQEAFEQKQRKKYSFLKVFDCFQPCERMRKHAFVGRNTQHINQIKYNYCTFKHFIKVGDIKKVYNIFRSQAYKGIH